MLVPLEKPSRDVSFDKTPEEIVKNNLAVINRAIKSAKDAESTLEHSLSQIVMGVHYTRETAKNLTDARLKDRFEAIDESLKALLKALPAVTRPISSIEMLSR